MDAVGPDPVPRLGQLVRDPFAAIGALIAAIGIALTPREKRGRAKAGLVLNGIVIIVAVVRLNLGGGLI